MKKLTAMLLALCMMAMMAPALAESSADLGALLDQAGEVMNGEGDAAGLSGLLGALGSNGDQASDPTFTAVPAESVEQFYGTWTLSKVAVGGLEFPMEMLALLGVQASGEMTISENTIKGFASFNDGSSDEPTSKEAEVAVEMALADGALNVTLQGETLAFQLTDAGELACVVPGVGTVFFTPAA